MAGSPKYKVFNSAGVYQASCKEIEAAACLVGFYGDGSTIRTSHAKSDTVWTEGADGQSSNSWDVVADIAANRERERHIVGIKKNYGKDAPEMLAKLGLA